MIVLAALALVGLGVSILLPANPLQTPDTNVAPPATAPAALDTAV